MTPTNKPTRRSVVFVTGMSGAGKSTALNILEDYGFEAVDNLPVSLLANLVLPEDDGGPIAIGIDVRSRDFDVDKIIREIKRLSDNPGLDVTLLFLDCSSNVLENRFKTTRRRHPLAHDRRVRDGIDQERDLIRPLKECSNMVVDTTERNVVEFRHLMENQFKDDHGDDFALFVTSFSFARGVPSEADMVFDVRFLKNPHYDTDLRPLTGRDAAVGVHIESDPDYGAFLANLKSLIAPLLPRYAKEGKSYLTIAVGCTGGRHRSVFVTEQLAQWLGELGNRVHVLHRDVDGK